MTGKSTEDTGQSFYNAALTGSGSILPDGTYGEPRPDPTEIRGLGPDTTSGGRPVGLVGNLAAPQDGEPEPAKASASKTAPKKATGSEK